MSFKLGSQISSNASRGVIKNKMQFNRQASNSHIKIPGETIIRKDDMGEVLGLASNDGNIYINNIIEPGSVLEHETIAEEIKHMTDLKTGKLAYDDHFIYFRGQAYERHEDQIKFEGKMYQHGDSRLPWESDAKQLER
tara:strand:- start:2409 stop:2822 length:414 start_codon:yes stop_codon:yes gene_type:complete